MRINEVIQQKKGLTEAPEYTTPGGIIVPGGAKTAASATPAPAAATTATTAAPAAAAKSTAAAPGSFKAQAGVFGRALGQAAMQALLPGANTGGTAGARSSDAQASAAKISEPVLRKQAEDLTKTWNDMVTDQMKQSGVSSPAQLSAAQQRLLQTNLDDILDRTLLQGKFSGDYRSLPRWVDQPSQSQAQQTVRDIDQAMSTILNPQTQPKDLKQQQEHWYNLAKAANQAMRLSTFNPVQYGSIAPGAQNTAQKPPPRISKTPTNQYRLGDQVLDPRNPADAVVIAKIQAAEQP